MNIKNYSLDELNKLANDIRKKIIDVVSKNGGHLSSNIGATELIIALHHVLDYKKDPFIFDVSHQSYPHKLLTDRWDNFNTLRQFNGISGFTKPSESDADYFVAGHSSTSISIAVGAAKAFKIRGEDRVPIAIIGDGSMTSGMVYEALNELGGLKLPLVIVLNDNEMSIAKPIGAISNYLSQIFTSNFYQKLKHNISAYLKDDGGVKYIAKKLDESLRLLTPGIWFEEMEIEYIGPLDGHDIKQLSETFKKARNLKKPVVVHVRTIKGKGYEIAEGKYEKWHGVGPFDIKSGKIIKNSNTKSATAIFSDKLLEIASKNSKVVGFTAAMPSGTGMDKLLEAYPARFWDVAIAEQHAVTSAATLAKEGFIPFVAIYSTFLQRAFDQIIHDVAIMNLPVIFAIDRAGIVGEDGETHQGVFDISYLRLIPNLIIFAPSDEKTLQLGMDFAVRTKKPIAFRYPRGGFILQENIKRNEFQLGISEVLKQTNSNILFIGYGNAVGEALQISKTLDLEVSVVDLRFVKPLDERTLRTFFSHKKWFVFSQSAKIGGVATAILEFLSKENVTDIKLHSFEYEDSFIPHGNSSLLEESLALDIKSKIKIVKNLI